MACRPDLHQHQHIPGRHGGEDDSVRLENMRQNYAPADAGLVLAVLINAICRAKRHRRCGALSHDGWSAPSIRGTALQAYSAIIPMVRNQVSTRSGQAVAWTCAPQAECVPAAGVRMHFDGHAAFECREVDQHVLDAIDGVVFVLQQKRERCLGSDVHADIGIQQKTVLGERQVSRSSETAESGRQPSLSAVSMRDALQKMRADMRREVAARRVSQNADLMRIHSPLGCIQAQQTERPLRILHFGMLD